MGCIRFFFEVNFDGSGSLFCSRAAETSKEIKWFFDDVVAGSTLKFLLFFNELYKRASYFGMIDIGVGLTGLENSVDLGTRDYITLRTHHYNKSDYMQTKRVSAMALDENPVQIASDLVMPLISAMSQGKYNPFKSK